VADGEDEEEVVGLDGLERAVATVDAEEAGERGGGREEEEAAEVLEELPFRRRGGRDYEGRVAGRGRL
jgi:hypothetical protein